MESISIYNNNGDVVYTAPITDSCERSQTLQGDNYVRLVWNDSEYIEFVVGCYIVYNGVKFYIVQVQTPTKKADNHYAYSIKFLSIDGRFANQIFMRHVEVEGTIWKEPVFSLNANLLTIAEVVITALNHANFGYTFSLPTNNAYSDTKLNALTFESNTLAEAVAIIAETFETEWWLEQTNSNNITLHFDKCERGDLYQIVGDGYEKLQDGRWNSKGLSSMTMSGDRNIIPQKVFVYGSDRNIIEKTIDQQTQGVVMQVSYDTLLKLPAGQSVVHIDSINIDVLVDGSDSSITLLGVNTGKEEVKTFDDIYPKMTQTITEVREVRDSQDFPYYYVKADGITSSTMNGGVYDGKINPSRYGLLIGGTTLKATFESGRLNGFEFDCAWDNDREEIGFVPSESSGMQLPYGTLIPEVGDKFVLWNLEMPTSAVVTAQQELLAKSVEYIEEIAQGSPEIKCKTDSEFMMTSGMNITLGQRVQIESNIFNGGYVQSRIQSYSYKLTKPYEVDFTASSARATGRLATIENTISEVGKVVEQQRQITAGVSRRQSYDVEEMRGMLKSIQTHFGIFGRTQDNFYFTSKINYREEEQAIEVSEGVLQHATYVNNDWHGVWNIQSTSINLEQADNTKPYYLYFVCPLGNNIASTEISTTEKDIEQDDNYYFLAGILSSVFEGERVFNQASGLTSIAGGTLTTQVMQDTNRHLIVDFVNKRIIARNGAEIIGNIKFIASDGSVQDLNIVDTFRTSIDGGVVMTNIISLANPETGEVQSGLSGLNDNIALWAGGTYEQALEGNVSVLIYRNAVGSKIGCLHLTQDGDIVVHNGGESVRITDRLIDSIVLRDTAYLKINKFEHTYQSSEDVSFNNTFIDKNATGVPVYYFPAGEDFKVQNTSIDMSVYFTANNIAIGRSYSIGVHWSKIVLYTYKTLGLQIPTKVMQISGSGGYTVAETMATQNHVSDAKNFNIPINFDNLNFSGYLALKIEDFHVSIFLSSSPGAVGNVSIYINNIETNVSYPNKQVSICPDGMIFANNSNSYFKVKSGGSRLKVKAVGLPTTSSNLESGEMYISSGTLKIKQ